MYGYSNEVSAMISAWYTAEMKTNIGSLLGSSDLIGNPNYFKKSMGKGLKELTDAPARGFDKGMFQGVGGVVTGTAGLAKFTVAGFMGSGSRFAAAINKPITMLSLD